MENLTPSSMPGDVRSRHDNDNNSKHKTRLSEWFHKFFKNITVEPLLICYMMPGIIASIAVSNLNIEKACRVNLNHPKEVCDKIAMHVSNNSTFYEEIEVQEIITATDAWMSPIYSAIPLWLIIFIGAWSDRTGKRKACFLFPITGEIITNIGLIMCTYFFIEWSIVVAGIIESIPPAVMGGSSSMFLGVYSYLADITTAEERTFRIGILSIISSIAKPVGTALSGILFVTIGYYGIFTLSLCFFLMAFMYGCIRIKDNSNNQSEFVEETSKHALLEFFHLKHVLNIFRIITKRRNFSKRKQIVFLLLSYIFLCGAAHGPHRNTYYYMRFIHGFDDVEYSKFSAYAIVMSLIGTTFALFVFTKHLKMSDYMLGVITCSSKVAASFVYAFAPNKYWFYLGPLVEIFGGAAATAIRSVITKVVDTNEIGKINSIMGLIEVGVNVIYMPMFSNFYSLTLKTFPGAFCILGGLLTLPTVGLLLYLYKIEKVQITEQNQHQQDTQLNTLEDETREN